MSLMELAKTITSSSNNQDKNNTSTDIAIASTHLGPDLFNSEFIFSLTGTFDDKNLITNDKNFL